MWTSENLADLGVNGVYQTLRTNKAETNDNRIGLNLWYMDQEGFTGVYRDGSPLADGTATAGTGLFSEYWVQNYTGIHRANDAIHNLPNAPLGAEKKGRLIAESKFLRAFFYYNLNQVYKGVPVYLTPITLEECTNGRETEDFVWDVIINDLTDCINEPNFPGFYTSGSEFWGRATKAAAYALRGKVYMWKKDWPKAESDLRAVGTLGPSLYHGEYKQLFKEVNEQCPEMIFSVQNIGESKLGSNTNYYAGSRATLNGGGWNTHMPNVDFVESFENRDGSDFNWDDYIPGYSAMAPEARKVFFLRDGLSDSDINGNDPALEGIDKTQYLVTGNEARIKAAYADRDPRLAALIITPYATYIGAANNRATLYTMRWPYYSDPVEGDLQNCISTHYTYLWRKWVAEGATEALNREYGPIDQPLIRYADVVLLLAEAINEQGFSGEAVDLVDDVRTRAGVISLKLKPNYAANQTYLRESIRKERRWELCLEGINYFDELRWGTLKEKKFTPNSGVKQIWGTVLTPYRYAGDYILKWAIPKDEIEKNRNLIQNDDWLY
jgi:hypothetical protein